MLLVMYMFYLYNYDFLIDKLYNCYNVNKLASMYIRFGKDLHQPKNRYRSIFEGKVTCFSQCEISSMIDILGLSDEDVIKCFFNVEKEFMYRKDLNDYVRSMESDN